MSNKSNKKKKVNILHSRKIKQNISKVICVGLVGFTLVTPLAYIITDNDTDDNVVISEYEMGVAQTSDYVAVRGSLSVVESLDAMIESVKNEMNYSKHSIVDADSDNDKYLVMFDESLYSIEVLDNIVIANAVDDVNSSNNDSTEQEDIPSDYSDEELNNVVENEDSDSIEQNDNPNE